VHMNFGFLARNTLPRPGVDVLGHGLPDKTGGDQAVSGTNAGVAKGVNVVKNWSAKGERN
jgi:hypothetical protein